MVKYRVIYDPNYQELFANPPWSDTDIYRFICHATIIVENGNVCRFHWCCGLDTAVQEGNYARIRAWINTHDYMVRRVLSYAIY